MTRKSNLEGMEPGEEVGLCRHQVGTVLLAQPLSMSCCVHDRDPPHLHNSPTPSAASDRKAG
jgi:hypothetical protein